MSILITLEEVSKVGYKRKEKNSFLLYYDYKELFEQLNDQQLRQLIYAMIEFDQNGNEIQLDPITKMAFTSIKKRLKIDKDFYEERCDTNRENILKRWKKDDTIEYDRIRSDTKRTDIERDKEKEKEREGGRDISIVRDSSLIRDKLLISNTVSPSAPLTHAPTLSDVITYGQEIGADEKYCEKFYDNYEGVGWINANGLQIKNWKAVFRNWFNKDLETGKVKDARKKQIDPDRVLEDEDGKLYKQNYDGSRYYI